MSEPVVFISHFNVKEGKLEALKQHTELVTKQIEAEKPGTVVFLSFLNEAENELSIIHVFPDAYAMDRHVEGAMERAKASLEFVEPTGRDIYGKPSEQVMQMLIPGDGSAINFSSKPINVSGFLRYKSG